MKRLFYIFFPVTLGVAFLFVSCTNNNNCVPTGNTATYTVTFIAQWSSSTHHLDFPSNAHFSPLIGATRNEQVVLWEPGGIASKGIESMAETGETSLLIDEIETAVSEGNACTVIEGNGVNPSPGSTTVSFTIGADRPLVTLTTMVAPSPDWFLGVHDLSLLDDNGEWLSELTVDLFVYDAGTDSGTTFTADDNDTNPQQPITLLSGGDFDTAFGQFVFVKKPM